MDYLSCYLLFHFLYGFRDNTIETRISFALVNEEGKIIANSGTVFNNQIRFSRKLSGLGIAEITSLTVGTAALIPIFFQPEMSKEQDRGLGTLAGIVWSINFIYFPFLKPMAHSDGVRSTTENIYKIEIKNNRQTITFNNVNVNDITDNLTIKVISVNNSDAEQVTQRGYIRIVYDVKKAQTSPE